MNIKIKDLSVAYNKNNIILNNLSLEIMQGKVYMILGLNGSGKTTFLKSLVGLLKPINGTILYGSKKINEMSVKERGKIIAYVSQINNYTFGILVKDYLSYGMANDIKFYQVPHQKHIEKINEIAKRFHIENLLEKRIDQISGGEKQIVSICAAILQDTPIIILDEPTSALDLKNQNLVLSILKKTVNTNRTIIFSSHNPNHGLFLDCDVVVLNKNTFIVGKAKEIIKPELLKEIYGDKICYSNLLNYNEISFKE